MSAYILILIRDDTEMVGEGMGLDVSLCPMCLFRRRRACLRIGSASASGSVHPITFVGVPKDIAPRMTLETFRPDFPRLLKWGQCQLAFHGFFVGLIFHERDVWAV